MVLIMNSDDNTGNDDDHTTFFHSNHDDGNHRSIYHATNIYIYIHSISLPAIKQTA